MGFHFRPTAVLVVSASIAVVASSAHAAVFLARVGDDAACGFRTSVLPNALQAAIDAVPTTVAPGDFYVVRVARTGNYVGTRIVVEERSLLIEGGFATCASASTDATNTTIDAAGTGLGPVRVRGTTARESVTLAKLTLRGGTGTSGSGVSIENADVVLDRVTATDNSALRGGGVKVEGTGLGARARLSGATRIVRNTATQEGGGVYCGRGAELQIDTSAAVSSNTALQGGGIHLNGCSGYANSGAIGLAGLTVNIGFNTATSGGGAIYANSTLGPTDFTIGLGLGPEDPAPLLVSNETPAIGGAVFATGADTRLVIADTLIDNNTAGNLGGGVVAHGDATVLVTRARRRCPRGDRCSEISNNAAVNGGGGVFAYVGGHVVVRGTYVEDNSANRGSAAAVQAGNAVVEFHNSLVAGSRDGESVFLVREPAAIGPDFRARLVLEQTTVTRNLDAAHVIDINTPGTARISHSIVNEVAAMPVFDRPAEYVPETDCSMLHEIASAGAVDAHTIAYPTPGFVDAAGGDYHLRPDAEATDRCARAGDTEAIDFESDARPFDGPLSDLAGRYDVGFDEFGDRIFADGFELPE